MNSFAALQLDSDDEEETPKTLGNKTAPKNGKAAPAKAKAEPKVHRLVPGEVAKPSKAAKPQPSKVPSAEPAVTDVMEASETTVVGKNKSHHNREAKDHGKPKPKRNQTHDRDHTGSGAAHDAKAGGGPGGRGNFNDEARRAEKGQFSAEDGAAASADAEEVEEAEPVAATFSFDQAMAARAEARSNMNSELFGSVEVRKVEAATFSVHERKDADFIPGTNMKVKKTKAAKASAETIECAFKIASTEAPREERSYGDRPDRAGRGGGRGAGRGAAGGRGAGRGGRGASSYANNGGSRIDIGSKDAFPSL